MERHYGLTAEMYRAVVALVDDRIEEVRVTRQDYDRLVQSQERVEGRMERVEAALEKLALAQARTEVAVGALAENVGFGLEDVARLMLPPYLHRHHGLKLKGTPG